MADIKASDTCDNKHELIPKTENMPKTISQPKTIHYFISSEFKSKDFYNSVLTNELVNVVEKRETSNNLNTLLLMQQNSEETTEFFSISKTQMKRSFLLSIITCGIGICLLIAAIVLALFEDSLNPSIITAIAGAITEVFAATSLWVHNKSAQQLNRYYDALHENEKFLSTINVVDKMSRDQKDAMYQEIIRHQLNSESKSMPPK